MLCQPNSRILCVVSKTADIHRAWADWLKRRTGLDISPLATNAGLAATTLARKDRDTFNGFSTRVIEALKTKYNVPGPDEWSLGFGEDDAAPYVGPPPDFDPVKIAAKSNAVDVWQVNTRTLARAGYMPGDLLLVDLSITPQEDDIVVAQIYDVKRGTAKTVLRVFKPPYLVSRALDDREEGDVLVLDPASISVKGVAVAMIRRRKARNEP